MTTKTATERNQPGKLPAPQLPGRPCSIARSLDLLGEKWALLALREIALGQHRFDDIVFNTGAPRDILAARLKSLEAAGVVQRQLYQERWQYSHFSAIWEMTSNHGRLIFCDRCDAVTAASEGVCRGCGTPLLDIYRSDTPFTAAV